MKFIKTLILFLILAILAGYVYFYEIKGGEEREEAKSLAQNIINFEPDSVNIIEIRSIFNRFLFKRSADEWQIRKPVQTDGDKSSIDGLLNTIKNIKKVRQFPIRNGEQKDYGLVARSILVILEFNDGRRDSVRIGDNTPVGNNLFLLKGDTTVFTAASYIKNSVTKQLFDWRDKSIAKVKQSDIKEFKLKNTKGRFHLIKEGKDWHLLYPRKTRAENSQSESILRKFETGKAKAIVSENAGNPAKYNLQDPAYRIDLYLGSSKAHKQVILSELTNNSSNVIDDSRPQVMTVDSLFIKDIDKSFFELRHKKIAEYDKGKVDSVVTIQGDSSFYFVYDTSGTWWYNKVEKVKNWKMNSYLNALNNLKATEFLIEDVQSTSKYGLSRPARVITCYGKGELIQSIRLNDYNGKKIAFSPSAEAVVEVEESIYNNLEVKKDEFLESPVQLTEDAG